jgi:hypothetical protein
MRKKMLWKITNKMIVRQFQLIIKHAILWQKFAENYQQNLQKFNNILIGIRQWKDVKLGI